MDEVRAVGAVPGAPGQACSQCGGAFAEDEMIRYGEAWVCASCKPAFFQRLKEGVAAPGTRIYAGFWMRFAAKVIDWIVLAIPNLVISSMAGILAAFALPKDSGPLAGMLIAIVQLPFQMALPVAYGTWFVGRFGATPGKMACGLKIVMPGGAAVSYWRAFGRCFAEWVSGMTLGIGYIMAGFDGEKRSLHDRICNTRVVKK